MKYWQAHIFILSLTLMLVFSGLSDPLLAQDRPCVPDGQKLCPDVKPDDRSGMLQCLKDHEADLSDACKQRLQTFAHEPCAGDVEKLCSDSDIGNKLKMLHCLKEHETALSDGCKERLNSFWGRLL